MLSRLICLPIILTTLLLASCVSRPETRRYEFHQTEMGVPFRMVLYAPSPAAAESASAAAFQRIKQLNDIMTDYGRIGPCRSVLIYGRFWNAPKAWPSAATAPST
jgi:hypothetical protein